MGEARREPLAAVRSYDSHADFYRDTYGKRRATVLAAAREDVNRIDAFLGAGEITCAATPDLVLVMVHGRPTVSVDVGFGRFTRRMIGRACILIPPQTRTAAYAQDPHRATLLAIRWSYALALAPETNLPADGGFGVLHNGPMGHAAPLEVFDRITAEVADGNANGTLFLDGAVMTLLATLAQAARAPVRLPSGGLAGWQLRRVTEYMTDRLDQTVTLTELADLARLSPFHFARAFKATTGEPPHRYHTRLRIERAKEMLQSTDLAVTEVALAVGYDSPQSLARAFRGRVGASPTDWRRKT